MANAVSRVCLLLDGIKVKYEVENKINIYVFRVYKNLFFI